MTYQQRITHFLGQSIGSLLKVFKWHPKKQKSNPTLSEESNKTLMKIPSQDSSSEIEWDIEDLKQAYVDAAEQSWDKYSGG
jgi:hypothetical protein